MIVIKWNWPNIGAAPEASNLGRCGKENPIRVFFLHIPINRFGSESPVSGAVLLHFSLSFSLQLQTKKNGKNNLLFGCFFLLFCSFYARKSKVFPHAIMQKESASATCGQRKENQKTIKTRRAAEGKGTKDGEGRDAALQTRQTMPTGYGLTGPTGRMSDLLWPKVGCHCLWFGSRVFLSFSFSPSSFFLSFLLVCLFVPALLFFFFVVAFSLSSASGKAPFKRAEPVHVDGQQQAD